MKRKFAGLLLICFILLTNSTLLTGCSVNGINNKESTKSSNSISKSKSLISTYMEENDEFKAIYIEYYHMPDYEYNVDTDINYGKFYLINKGAISCNKIKLEGNRGSHGHEEDEIDFGEEGIYIVEDLNIMSPYATKKTLDLYIDDNLVFELKNIDKLK